MSSMIFGDSGALDTVLQIMLGRCSPFDVLCFVSIGLCFNRICQNPFHLDPNV